MPLRTPSIVHPNSLLRILYSQNKGPIRKDKEFLRHGQGSTEMAEDSGDKTKKGKGSRKEESRGLL